LQSLVCAVLVFLGARAPAETAGWRHRGQVPLNLEPFFDNDAIADARDRADGNFDCPDHPADLPGSVFPAEFLPATGSVFSFDGVHFLFPSKERGDYNNLACSGQRIAVPAGRYKALHLVGASENGNQQATLKLSYKEGLAEAAISLTDWCQKPRFGERVAFEADFRYTYAGGRRRMKREAVRPRLFLLKIALDPKKTLEAIILPYCRRMHIFAATVESADWTDEQAEYARETAEFYATLSKRQPGSYEGLLRRAEALASRLARSALSGPMARQMGWLWAQAEYLRWELESPMGLFRTRRLSRELRRLEADARAVAAGNDPFPARRGCFLRAYRSEVDGSLQTYSLAVPDDYTPENPFPLIVTLHGHGWYRPFQGHPQQVVPRFIVVAPQGRGSQDYMLLAEDDVPEVIRDVRRDYNIDPDRIYLEGHSMGGTGTWHIGVHHPDLFAALAPVCGNADGAAWAHWMPRRRQPYPIPERFKALRQHLLAATDPITYAGNLVNTPWLAAHGARDEVVPVENSRNMARRLRELGCPGEYREFPNIGHWGFPQSFYEERWEWMTSQRRQPSPPRIRYRTASLRHDGAWWARITRFQRPLEFAEIDAVRSDLGSIAVKTRNVAAFSLDLALAFGEAEAREEHEVVVDGQRLRVRGPKASFVLSNERWRVGEPAAGLAKKAGLEGPVADAFRGSFLLVRGTISADPWEREVVRRQVEARASDWERMFNCRPRVKADTEVTEADIARHNLVLYGGPAANAVTARVARRLPIAIEDDAIRVGDRAFSGGDVGTVFCYPNPLNPERYVVVFAGLSPAALDQINNRFGNWFGWGPYDNYLWFDYGVFDARTHSPESFLCVGFFDQRWRLDGRYKFTGDERARAARRPHRVPPLRQVPEPPPAALYLSDLTPVVVDQHKGAVGYDRSFLGNPLTLGGKVFERGIGVKPPSVLEYEIGGHYSRLKATIGIDLEDDLEVTKARRRAEYVQFAVYGDGRRLYSSEWLQAADPPVEIEVDLEGAKRLRLEVTCSSQRWLVGSADWAEPRLER